MARFTHILLPMRRIRPAPERFDQLGEAADELQRIRVEDAIAYEIVFKRNDYIWLTSKGRLVGYVRIVRVHNGKNCWYAYFRTSSAVAYPRRKKLAGYWSGRLSAAQVRRWLCEIKTHNVPGDG